jgi:uncharacterized protein
MDAQAYLIRAHAALADTHLLLDHGRTEAALNRAYYAAFYAAMAALGSVGERPRTHTGTHQRFRARFVLSGRVAADVARVLPHSYAARQRADYDAIIATDEAAARDLLADVERFVAAVEGLLAQG